MEQPKCKYKCQQCQHEFWREKPGSVTCEICKHKYVDWINSVEVLTYLYNHIPELSNRRPCEKSVHRQKEKIK
jgi:hypothetical protein